MRSAESGSPIARATVVAGGRRVRADEEGRFRVCRVHPATDEVRALAPGYDEASVPVSIVPRGTVVAAPTLRRDSVIHVDDWRTAYDVPSLLVVDDEPALRFDPSGCAPPGERGLRFAERKPEDVESVELLKGRAAVATYGPAAAAGVILIRTRSGGPATP